MTTDATATASARTARPTRSHPPRWRSRLARWGFWLLVLGLIGFNAWWLARDLWPLPGTEEINRLIGRKQYAEADQFLRERLRRSPHDGEAMMTLARSLALQDRMLDCAKQLHQVPYWWPEKPEALFLEGETYRKAGYARLAERAWRRCVFDDPLHPTPLGFHKGASEELIELYATEERWPEAREVIWTTYDRVPESQHPYIVIMWLRTEVERIAPKRVPPPYDATWRQTRGIGRHAAPWRRWSRSWGTRLRRPGRLKPAWWLGPTIQTSGPISSGFSASKETWPLW